MTTNNARASGDVYLTLKNCMVPESSYVNPVYNSRSETDLNKHWEISASLGPTLSGGGNRQKYNSHDTLEPNLSIEDAFDKAMSLPSSPTVKNAEDSFDSFEDDVTARKPRSASEKNKKETSGFRDRQAASPSSSLALGMHSQRCTAGS